MKFFNTRVFGIVWIALLVCACARTEPSAPVSVTEVPDHPDQNPSPASEQGHATVPSAPTVTAPVPRELVERARLDLAERFDISPDQIGVAEAHAVEWPDASLGCPQPSMAYAAVITPGYWILLETQDRSFPYHTDLAETVILCESDPAFSGSRSKDNSNVVDGWPNQTKGEDVIIVTPTRP